MNAVGMEMLLRSHGEIQRLKWKRSPAIQVGKQPKHGWIAGDALHLRNFVPGILHPQVRHSTRTPAIPIVMTIEGLDDCGG